MTIGEKLKELRRRFALSQESLAEKLNVTRQAITKWENDISLPDTNNLVELSRLYGVSVDSLLNIHYGLPNQIIMKESINLEEYDQNENYESIIKERFNEFEITALIRTRKMNKLEWLFDFIIGAGTVELADTLHDMSPYYLVEKNGVQLLVNIKKDCIITQELIKPFDKKKCILDGNIYAKSIKLK